MNSKNIVKLIFVFFLVLTFSLSILIFPVKAELHAAGNGIKVFIDAGHGGRDPGAVRNGLNEKEANIAIAFKLKSKLEADGFTVIMSRSGDQHNTLNGIVSLANNSGADIFISIHNNSSISPNAHGTETYWNANGVNGSNQLAGHIQSNLVSQIGRANRGVKTANFRVIKYTTMPAALVECAFVSNATEAELLKSGDFQDRCATGLFNGIKKFAEGINKSTENYTDTSGSDFAGFDLIIDEPRSNTTFENDFLISGWAADLTNIPPKGLAKVEIYKGLEKTEDNFLGQASRFDRPDLGREDILESGYFLRIGAESLPKGENILYVYAFDANDNYTYRPVKVNVIKEEAAEEEPNINPIANPGGPYEGIAGEEISFDGSASADSDGEITGYTWNFGDGDTGTGVNPAHAYSEAGTYNITLTVADDKGANSSEVVTTATIAEQVGEEDTDDTSQDEQSDSEDNDSDGEGTEDSEEGESNDQTGEEEGQGQDNNGNEVSSEVDYDTGINIGSFSILIDSHLPNSTLSENFVLIGWAADLQSSLPARLDKVEIFTNLDRTGSSFLGKAEIYKRPDLGRIDLLFSGFYLKVDTDSLDAGSNVLYIFAYNENGDYSYRSFALNIIKDTDNNDTNNQQEEETDEDDSSGEEQSQNDSDTQGQTEENNNQQEESQTQTPDVESVSNATNVIGYTDVTVDQLVKIFSDRNSTKMDKARRIAQYYIDYGKLFNLRADIVWAQMIHETGFLEYTGDVGPDQNNFAGIGATGGGVIGNSFASEELGVIAHYSHLAWYYYPEHINEYCNNQYDPRHFGTTHYKYTGDASLGHLNGRWAPGNTYTDKIILFVNQIFGS